MVFRTIDLRVETLRSLDVEDIRKITTNKSDVYHGPNAVQIVQTVLELYLIVLPCILY